MRCVCGGYVDENVDINCGHCGVDLFDIPPEESASDELIKADIMGATLGITFETALLIIKSGKEEILEYNDTFIIYKTGGIDVFADEKELAEAITGRGSMLLEDHGDIEAISLGGVLYQSFQINLMLKTKIGEDSRNDECCIIHDNGAVDQFQRPEQVMLALKGDPEFSDMLDCDSFKTIKYITINGIIYSNYKLDVEFFQETTEEERVI